MAFRNLRCRRLKITLTVSGMVIGIATIFVPFTLVAGVDVQIH
jgi:hypothetical protein